ncbi:MAG: DegV family protein [Chloroflexota bacterium]|nr:DegV family protein [Chloroflexota bacterium]
MGSIGIVTDSTADLQPALQEHYGLGMVPLIINWDGQTFRDKLDLSTADFYHRLRTSKTLPKTGAPSLSAFESAFREQLEHHDGVISVNLASKLSGTFGVARKAAESVDAQRISVIDSGSVSVCVGWLAEMAASLAQQGVEREAIVEKLEKTRHRLRIFFLLETLEFLQRGGRIGRAAALAGTLLSVKPILSIRDGDVAPVERVRTMKAALRRLVELASALGPIERLGVVDGDAAANTAEVERQFQARFPDLTIERGALGPVLGVHGGPGVVGVGILLAG